MPGDSLPPHAVEASDRAARRRWLYKHHHQTQGVWLIMARPEGDWSAPSVEEAVLEALCFGWIESKTGRLDETRSLLWFAPRKPKSAWSGPHQRMAERLIDDALMTPAGQTKVDAARKQGLWHKPS